jgi:hypothetical protein
MNKTELMEKLKRTIDMVATLTQLHHTLSRQTMDKCVLRQHGLSCGACSYVTDNIVLFQGMQLYHPDQSSQTCIKIEKMCLLLYQEFLCDVQTVQYCRIQEKKKKCNSKKRKHKVGKNNTIFTEPPIYTCTLSELFLFD